MVPVKIALREALRPSKKPRGRPKTTYLQVIKTQITQKTVKGGEQSSRTQAFERIRVNSSSSG